MMRMMSFWQTWSPVRRTFAVLAAFLSLLLLVACGLIVNELFATNLIADKLINTPAIGDSGVKKPTNETLQRGAYLAKVGNCAACHTARGGAAFAGGKAIATPFGTVYTSNITPDVQTDSGRWSAAVSVGPVMRLRLPFADAFAGGGLSLLVDVATARQPR